MNDTIPWYKSRVLQGLIASAVTGILAHFHLSSYFTSADISGIVDWIMDGISFAALVYAAHGRVTKPSPPVAISKAAADKANAVPFVKPQPENPS